MRQILFHIPREAFGWPVFGLGWLMTFWIAASVIVLLVHTRRHGWGPEARGYLPTIALGAAVIYFAPHIMDDIGLPIRGYGMMMLLAVVLSVWLAAWRAQQAGIDPEIIYSLAVWLFIFGIVGARVFYVIQYWPQFNKPNPIDTLKGIVNYTQGGLVVYGSVLGGALALFLFVRKHHLPGLALADLIAPSVILGMGIGRIGCFFTGCCWGGPCELPWAVTFPWGSPPHADQADRGLLLLEGIQFSDEVVAPRISSVEPDSPAAKAGLKAGDLIRAIQLPPQALGEEQSPDGWEIVDSAGRAIALLEMIRPGGEIALRVASDKEPRRWTLAESPPRSRGVHPTQIYSAVDAILLCLVLIAYTPFRRRDGELCALFFTLHPISRFMLETLRREPSIGDTRLSIGQLISVGILVVAVGLWAYVLSRPPGLAWTYQSWFRRSKYTSAAKS